MTQPTTAPTMQPVSRPATLARRLGGAVALVAAAFVQAPGRLSADTKLDLLVDPVAFLGRAWTLWEPQGQFGQLQNQAYGYFLPMGPFFALGHLLQAPAWVVQRAWWALLLVVAYGGVLVLADRLGIGTSGTRVLAALAFALSPRAVTELGGISAELWPSAVAPWVLVPIVGARAGTERRSAARSAVAVACAGGVNAVAAGATLPLAVVWLVAGVGGRVRRRLALWWALLVPAAIAWWLVPLVVLGRFSPPFLDWIESASVTTSVASLSQALRGTTHWVAWLGGASPEWPAGTALVTTPVLVALGWVGVVLAVAGLLMRSTPHRTFLVGGVVVGLLLLTLGNVGAATPPWAGAVRDLLDGPLAALRNTHKFDVVVRLPLALGLAHAVAAIRLPVLPQARWSRHGVRVLAVCAVLGTAVPVLVGNVPARGTFREVPPYWHEAADWLATHDDGGRTLVVPGATFATSLWGDPRDEPLQALARTPWAARNVVPLSSAGNIRMLTTVEAQLATGRGSPGLAAYLARAGVTRLLVRADLSGVPEAVPRAVTVRSALSGSPGLSPEVRFGPVVGGARLGNAVFDDGLDVVAPALEVWRVSPDGATADSAPAGADPRVEVRPVSDAVRVAGGPENLLALDDLDLLRGRPTVLAGDPEASAVGGLPLVATDGPQRREASFAAVRDVWSAPLGPLSPWYFDRRVHDWDVFDGPRVTAAWTGSPAPAATPGAAGPATAVAVTDVSASSSVDALSSPWAALDGDPLTAWRSRPLESAPAWWRVTFAEPVEPPRTLVVVPAPQTGITAVDVVTEAGRRRTTTGEVGADSRRVEVPPGPTRWLRVEVTEQRGTLFPQPAAFTSVVLPGIDVSRPLRLPAVGRPDEVVLRTPRDGADGCVRLGTRPLCGRDLARRGEEDALLDRLVTLPAGGWSASATVRPRADASLDALLRPAGAALVAQASSRRSEEASERPQSAVDRDLGTAWVADPADPAPTLTLSWPSPRTVSSLQLQTDAALAASRASRIEVAAGGETRTARVGADGRARFEPLTGTSLRITVTDVRRLRSVDRFQGLTDLPFGVSEVVVPGLDDLRVALARGTRVRVPCGGGPSLDVGGTVLPTAVVGTVGEVLRGDALRALPCKGGNPVVLPGGEVRVRLAATAAWAPQVVRLVATSGRLGAAAPADAVTVHRWDAGTRAVQVPAGDAARLLVVHENANPGWRATLAGRTLRSVRVDGWQQGWLLPAGAAGTVTLEYTPATAYRTGLVAGAGLLLAVLLLALPRRRRAVDGPAADAHRPPQPLGRAASWPVLVAAGVTVVVAGGWPAAAGLAGGAGLLSRGRRAALAGALAALGVGAGVVVLQGARGPSNGWTDHVVAVALWWAVAGAVVLLPRRTGSADDATEPALERPLDQVPGGRRGGDGEDGDAEQQRQERDGEDPQVEPLGQRDEDDHVPEEEPVADRPRPHERA